jgi:hypothetical protein
VKEKMNMKKKKIKEQLKKELEKARVNLAMISGR